MMFICVMNILQYLLYGLHFCILHLAKKEDITLILSCLLTHLKVKADYLWQGRLVPKWYLLPHSLSGMSFL